MCGRFTLRVPLNVLVDKFDAQPPRDPQRLLFQARYNIAPTQEIWVVRREPGSKTRTLASLRWGLVPPWSNLSASGPPLINARADTLSEKPSFRAAFRQRRCLIPADGFYEWQQTGRGKKQPFFIHRPDHQPFAFAGLWERCDTSPEVESCTLVTTEANDTLRELHHRMPVILAPQDYDLWLDPAVQDTELLQPLLAPAPNDELIAEPVGMRVNRVANDDPACIASAAPADNDRLLF